MDKAYELSGLDCASCAADIENALRKEGGLESSCVNFAAGTVYLNPDCEQTARKVLKKVMPSAKLTVVNLSARAIPAAGGQDGIASSESGATAGNTTSESTAASTSSSNAGGPASPDSMSVGRILRSANILRILGAASLFVFALVFSGLLQDSLQLPIDRFLFLAAFLLAGAPVILGALRNLLRGKMFNELFLMSVASIGAIVIGEIPEAVAVMLFYAVGEELQNRAVGRSRRAIKSMMSLRPEKARILDGGRSVMVNPESVEVGSIVEIHAGELVPLDGELIDGESWVNSSALTGEPLPQRVTVGSEVMAGYVNEDGRIRIRVTRLFGESSAARIVNLIENAAGRKSPTEKFLTRFAAVYTPVVVVAALLLATLPPLLFGGLWEQWVYRAMVLLVISCPCALVVSVPLGYFAGIGRASRDKILVKGANVLDSLKNVQSVIFDKTGTLTEGRFRVRGIYPAEGMDRNEFLATAAAAESLSSHPIARSIREEYSHPVKDDSIENYRELRGMGIIATIGNHRVLAGNRQHLEQEGVSVPSVDSSGTLVFLSSDGEYSGYLVLDDSLKENTADALAELRTLGVRHIAMLTGDSASGADRIGQALALDELHSQLLPEDKMEHLERMMSLAPGKSLTAFVGDGLNDAPVIMRADVGIAMGGIGRDAAIEAADVVLMDDSPLRIPAAIRIARFTRRIVLQNIVFALSIKSVFIVSGALGGISMWAAVFADVGVTLMAVLNSMRILGRSGMKHSVME